MINAWSLLYDEINGTMDKTYPIKENVMSDKIEIKIEGGDEGVVNVPSDINLDDYEHSNAWYDYNRNDPDRENPFTDAFDHLMGEKVTGKAEELTIKVPNDDRDVWVYESPDGGKTVTRRKSGSLDKEVIQKPSGIEDQTIRKYKEDESIKALQDYISTTYGGHYTSDNNNVQTHDLIESVGDAEAFCRSNAIKYLTRYDKKGQAKRDILKALHYSLLLYHFSGQLNETPTRGYETF